MTDTTEGPYADDPQSESAREKQTVTNDAVGGETVEPVDSYAGPNGAEKAEAEPTYSPRDDLDPDDIVLREVDDPSETGVRIPLGRASGRCATPRSSSRTPR